MKRFFETALGAMVLAAALLLLAISAIGDALASFADGRPTPPSKPAPSRRPARPMAGEMPGEFCFERAIPAYEALIDAVAAERRR